MDQREQKRSASPAAIFDNQCTANLQDGMVLDISVVSPTQAKLLVIANAIGNKALSISALSQPCSLVVFDPVSPETPITPAELSAGKPTTIAIYKSYSTETLAFLDGGKILAQNISSDKAELFVVADNVTTVSLSIGEDNFVLPVNTEPVVDSQIFSANSNVLTTERISQHHWYCGDSDDYSQQGWDACVWAMNHPLCFATGDCSRLAAAQGSCGICPGNNNPDDPDSGWWPEDEDPLLELTVYKPGTSEEWPRQLTVTIDEKNFDFEFETNGDYIQVYDSYGQFYNGGSGVMQRYAVNYSIPHLGRIGFGIWTQLATDEGYGFYRKFDGIWHRPALTGSWRVTFNYRNGVEQEEIFTVQENYTKRDFSEAEKNNIYSVTGVGANGSVLIAQSNLEEDMDRYPLVVSGSFANPAWVNPDNPPDPNNPPQAQTFYSSRVTIEDGQYIIWGYHLGMAKRELLWAWQI